MSNKPFEWSMGNGQCPCCEGMGPVFAALAARMNEGIGHKPDCELAELMIDAGRKPMMRDDQ